jgi:hypothetical protein
VWDGVDGVGGVDGAVAATAFDAVVSTTSDNISTMLFKPSLLLDDVKRNLKVPGKGRRKKKKKKEERRKKKEERRKNEKQKFKCQNLNSEQSRIPKKQKETVAVTYMLNCC